MLRFFSSPRRIQQFKTLSRSLSGKVKKHNERRLLKHPQSLLYDVVADVANYHHFVPWCKNSHVLESSDSVMVAELEVGFRFFSEKYISNVELNKPNSVVATSSQMNLFDHLRSEWHFKPSGSDKNSTWVTFTVEFQFKSEIYNDVSELFMQDVVKKMVKAFEDRCKVVSNQQKHQ